MKFTCNKKELTDALNNVTRAVPQKSPMQFLECVKFYLDANKLTLTGYDMELAIVTSLEVNSTDHGIILLNARLFSDIVRKLPQDTVTVEIEENLRTTIVSGKSVFTIPALSADDYPELPDVDKTDFFEFEQPVLKNMIEQTIYAVATSDSKPILKGELFDIEDGMFNLVAIDGFRLAIRHESIKTEDKFNFVVKAKALSELSKLLSDDGDKKLTVYVTKKHAAFDMGDYTLVTRLLEGEFHKYKGSIPKKFATSVVVDTKSIIDMLERSMLMIVEHTKAAVRCSFKEGSLNVSCSTALGNFSDMIFIDMEGDDVEIGFNCRYFLDALRATGCDKIRLKLGGSLAPMTVVPFEGDEFTFLVLPVRLK